MADYIHRAGRTGRVGSKAKCRVTTFVSFTPDIALIQQLEYAVRTGKPLDNINANIKKLYNENWERKQNRKKTAF